MAATVMGMPTDLSTILTALQTTLTSAPFVLPSRTPPDSAGPFDPSQVLPTLARDDAIEKYAVSMKDVLLAIRPHTFPIDKANQLGGGRYNLAIDGTLEFQFYSRLWTGLNMNDYQQLVAASYGVLANWKAILDLLEQYVPLDPDGSGACILRQPMRVINFDIVPRKTTNPGWTRLDSLWSISYRQALTVDPL